jgi:hypothetical protein
MKFFFMLALLFLWNGSILSCPTATISNVPSSIVSGLPACNASSNGLIYEITDGLTPTIGVLVVGGGAVALLVHCNGTQFVAG